MIIADRHASDLEGAFEFAPRGREVSFLKLQLCVGEHGFAGTAFVSRTEEFVEIFQKLFLKRGQNLRQLEEEWKQWVLELRPEPGAPDFRTMSSGQLTG